MKSRRQFGWFFFTLLLMSISTTILFAQDQDTASSAGNDPPARVARVQYISGEVSLQPGGANDWVAANLNRPLTTSDRVWADKNSRAELNVGNGFLRLNSESSLTLTNVGDNTLQVELDQGALEITVRHLDPGETFEVDTPNLAFTVMKPGVFRFDVNPNDDQTWVTVRKGYGEATGHGNAVKVSDGHQVRFSGQNSLQNVAYSAPAPDGFDDWAKVRDQRLDSSVSAQYVAPGVIGYQDLDYYGRWQTVPTYGAIWVPTSVPSGWAPYRYGHWVWISPWGWTWVDDAPWGFAPFHYGRWVSYGGYWGWAPGPIIGVGWRPYYAPALVGWIGGAGWGFGVSFGVGGGCGWFPLGWGEAYYPWYHGYRGGYLSRNYVRNVNVTNTHITNINNVQTNYYRNDVNHGHYMNRNVAGAVTAAPKSALASGQSIARVGTAVPRSELGRGEVVRNVNVSPTREAMLGGHATRSGGVPPRGAFDRPAVTRVTPPTRQSNPVMEADNVQHAPSTLGARNPNSATDAVRTHNVPRPPAATQQAGSPPTRADQSQAITRSAEAKAPARNVPRPPERSNSSAPSSPGYTSQRDASSQSGSQHGVPKPPYSGGAATSGTYTAERSPAVNHGERVMTPPHQAAPIQQSPASAPHSQQPKESKPHESPKSNPGPAATTVPQPPAGYSYRAAPAYSASSNRGGSAAYSDGGSPRSYSSSTSPYVSSRGSYSAPAPSYRSPQTYSTAPTYSGRAGTPAAPRYSAPSAPHYSGGGSGGGANYSGSRSGGGSHASNNRGGHVR